MEIVGVSLYFIGDYLPTVVSLNAYGGTEAVEQAKFAGKLCLGISILFSLVFLVYCKFLVQENKQLKKTKKKFLKSHSRFTWIAGGI